MKNKKMLLLVLVILIVAAVAIWFFTKPADEPAAPVAKTYDMTLNRAIDASNHVLVWEGKWELAAAYISEAAIEEFELENVTAGFIPVTAGTLTMDLKALLDASANDPSTGPIVDQGNYWHAHTHDMNGSMTFGAHADEAYVIKNTWNDWKSIVRGEQDGDFNYGPARIYLNGPDEDTLHWAEISGVEIEDFEEFKYLGLNKDGQLILCSTDKNAVTSEKAQIFFAYVFEKAQ